MDRATESRDGRLKMMKMCLSDVPLKLPDYKPCIFPFEMFARPCPMTEIYPSPTFCVLKMCSVKYVLVKRKREITTAFSF